MNSKRFLVVFVFFILTACSPQGLLLNEEQLARLIAREKQFNWVLRGFSGKIILAEDGGAALVVDGLGDDNGQWQQVKNQLCVQFEKALNAEKQCAFAVKFQNGTYEAWRKENGIRLGVFYPALRGD